MDLFDILSRDERVIVYSVEQDRQVYTWNRSLTLQVWNVGFDGSFQEVAIRTLSVDPVTYAQAHVQAEKFYYDLCE
jgi:hypothetical protein